MLFVVVLWVFFRLGIKESLGFFKELVTINYGNENIVFLLNSMIDIQFIICFIFAIVFIFPVYKKTAVLQPLIFIGIRYCVFIILLILSICSLASNSYNPFIYFRF
jgi:alginate O-acetyltransferase complex protein AlgI